MEIKCPKCGAADPMYSTKRAVYLCEECEHEWSAESLRSERPLPLRVFLSYGHDRNEELVLRIKSDLEERGHDVWLDKSEIKFTDDWRRAITEGIVESQRILSFLSRHSTRDPGVCLDEIAIAIGVKGGNIQTILVESELEVCPPASVSHVQWLDMHDWKERRNADEKSWEEWYGRKLEEIVRVVESEESRRFAGEMEDLKRHLQPVPSDSRINELIAGGFVGREWMKADLEKWRASEDRSSRIYWITGEPGAGKSAFAAYLSHYGRDRVVGAQFVQWDKPDHRNPERVVRNIAFQLAARLPDYRKLLLDLPEKDRLDGKNASELFDYLLAAPLSLTIGGGRERYLVVIDALDEAGEGGRNAVAEMLAGNVNRLPAWLCFVVTSRPESAVLRSFQRYDPFEISSHEDENRRDMREYLKKALADELAGRDEDERKRILEGILQRSEDVFLYVACVCEEVKEGRLSLDRPDEFPRGLGGVYSHYFERQFPDVGKYKETIRPMLQIVLASRESFPLELLRRRYGMTRGALSDLLAELSSLFHVKERAGEKCLSVYHKTLADWLTTDERSLDYWISLEDGNEELAEWGMELYRKAGANDLPEYFLRYLPAHLIESRREKDAAEFLADLDVFEKIHEKSGAEYALGEYWRRLRDGFPPAECYHASLRRRWPEESPEVERTHEEELERIEVHNTLSLFFGDVLADYKNAKAFSREVFSLCEKTLGADHLHTVVALNNLAGLLEAEGEYTSAKPLYERALSICEKTLGPYHPHTATSLNNLAGLRRVEGEYASARNLYKRALSILEKTLGADHPDTATLLNNLAGLLEAEGDYASAKPLYERALSICEMTLGPYHPHTATSLNNLAVLSEREGSYAAARPMHERALSIREETLGPYHPDTANSLNNLAALCKAEGDYASARRLCKRALSIREETLGPYHPDTAHSLNSMAGLYAAEGDYTSARRLCKRALLICEENLGSSHPETAASLNNLAELCKAEGDYASARPLYERALSIRESRLGPGHPDTRSTAKQLALLKETQEK